MNDKNCISEKITIKEAISTLDAVEKKILVVLNDNKKVEGTITDGDIRRGFLSGIGLDSTVFDVMNKAPILLHEKETKAGIIEKMEHELIFYVPLVNDKDEFIDLVSLISLKENLYSDYGVFILAGGLGSRLKDLTQDTPKPMLPINGKPMLERLILSFKEQGFHKFYLAVNYFKEHIIDHFGDGADYGVDIIYIEEGKRLGTAGPLSLLENDLVETDLIVINADVCIKTNYRALVNYHKKQKNMLTLSVKEYAHKIPYGVIRFEGDKYISMEEKPVTSYYVNAGIYVVNKKVLSEAKEDVYLDMPDYIEKVKSSGSKVGVYPLHEDWLDVGLLSEYEKAVNNV
jgi:dTDP-glucose pyrophosphorylase